MKVELKWKVPILTAAALIATAFLAGAQGFAMQSDTWWYAEIYWPNFLSFLIPSLLVFALVECANQFLSAGEKGTFARRWTWVALSLRLACLIIIPIALPIWGYSQDIQLHGLTARDAINATQTAWNLSQESTPLLSAWQRGDGDNTGGLTVLGVAMFRLFSPDLERPLLLGILAAAVTSLTVPIVFRQGEFIFNHGVARAAALIVAIYPEAVEIGSSHQQQGYLALLLGVELYSLATLLIRREDGSDLRHPGKIASLVILGGSLVGLFFISSQFLVLAIICGSLAAIWFTDPRKGVGRWLWGGAALGVVALIVIQILVNTDVITRFTPLYFFNSQFKYLYDLAGSEFNKMTLAGGGDLFQNLFSKMDRPIAYLASAFYGLLQPVLPAAIGYRNSSASGGMFWTVLGIFRGIGWYSILPLAAYGTLKSLRGIVSRRPVTILAFLFWLIAFIGSYRAFGDQWDNPRYRLFALVPMALLAAWAWREARETHDPWLARMVIPFAVAVVGLTVWYILRSTFGVELPMIYTLAGLGALTVLAFVLSIFLVRPGKPISTG